MDYDKKLLEDRIDGIKKWINQVEDKITEYENMKTKIEEVKEKLEFSKSEIIKAYTKLVDAYNSEEAKRESEILSEKIVKIKNIIDELDGVVSDKISKKLKELYEEIEASKNEKNRLQRQLNGIRL